jgi:hypothetical protein
MKTYLTRFEVPQPPDAVWAALCDFAQWAAWNPIIPGIRGAPGPGARLTLSLVSPVLPLRRPLPVLVRVVAFEPGRALRWKGGLPGIFTAEHGWQLESAGAGTAVIHEECFRGLLVPLLARRMDRTLPASYDAMNAGLQSFAARRVKRV